MSVRIMAQVWDLQLPDSEKLVLLALADAANDEGVCWPSIATIARKCTRGERTVQVVIKRLVESGHITRDEQPGRGVFYTVHPRSDCTPADAAPPQPLRPTPAAVAPHPRSDCGGPPQPLRPNHKEPSKNHQRTAAAQARAQRAPEPIPKIPIPSDWQPSEQDLAFVEQNTLAAPWSAEKLERVIHDFRDHYRRTGHRSADWSADWRLWVRRQPRFDQQAGGNEPDEHGFRDPILRACAADLGT